MAVAFHAREVQAVLAKEVAERQAAVRDVMDGVIKEVVVGVGIFTHLSNSMHFR